MVTRQGGQTLQQLDQRGCAVFILGDIQSSSRQGVEPPGLADVASRRGIAPVHLHKSQRKNPVFL